jgi:hypothetical protein
MINPLTILDNAAREILKTLAAVHSTKEEPRAKLNN